MSCRRARVLGLETVPFEARPDADPILTSPVTPVAVLAAGKFGKYEAVLTWSRATG